MERLAFRHRRRPPAGSHPGALDLAGGTPRQIHVMVFGPDHLEEFDTKDVESLARLRDGPDVAWIEVNGLGDEAGLRRLGELFEIHPLALADVVNVPQRPKAESYEKHDLVITLMARLDQEGDCRLEQVSFVIGPHWVISFEEEFEDVFDPVRARLRGGGVIRTLGADYLAYALVDTLIDGYYTVIEAVGDVLEELEDEAVGRPTRAMLGRIHQTRRLILTLARTTRQHRDALSGLARGDHPRISAAVRVYFRDAYDHAVQINEVLESYREIAVGLMEVYLSSVSNRMNEVMKVLTVIATVFIPLTFVVGIYGMNFDYMPELHIWWFYPALMAAMFVAALLMYIYFRRRGWIGRDDPDAGGDDA
jgi:magnesium transporter